MCVCSLVMYLCVRNSPLSLHSQTVQSSAADGDDDDDGDTDHEGTSLDAKLSSQDVELLQSHSQLQWQQFKAVFWVNMLLALRRKTTFFFQFIVPPVMIIVGIVLASRVSLSSFFAPWEVRCFVLPVQGECCRLHHLVMDTQLDIEIRGT